LLNFLIVFKMKTRISIIFVGIAILILGLHYGSPIEIQIQPAHRILTLILAIVIGLTFYLLVFQSIKIRQGKLKLGVLILTGLIGVLYILTGLSSIPQALVSSEYPMYKDISIYTNQDGDKVIGELLEYPSVLSYRNRKIIYDFGNGIRISYQFSKNKINGKWTYHRLRFHNSFLSINDTTYTTEFKKGQEIQKKNGP
jgi:hypothetical protein